jgi:hypothetical protein
MLERGLLSGDTRCMLRNYKRPLIGRYSLYAGTYKRLPSGSTSGMWTNKRPAVKRYSLYVGLIRGLWKSRP